MAERMRYLKRLRSAENFEPHHGYVQMNTWEVMMDLCLLPPNGMDDRLFVYLRVGGDIKCKCLFNRRFVCMSCCLPLGMTVSVIYVISIMMNRICTICLQRNTLLE